MSSLLLLLMVGGGVGGVSRRRGADLTTGTPRTLRLQNTSFVRRIVDGIGILELRGPTTEG